MAEEGDMAHSESKQGRQTDDKWLCLVVTFWVLVCLGFLGAYLCWTKREFTIDGFVLTLLFAGIGISLLPFASRLKIVGVLELERWRGKIEKVEVRQRALLRGEVVRDEYGKRFYIDDAGERHLIPDDQTARFLRSSKGEIPVSTEDLEPYPLADPMDSVISHKPLYAAPHIFVVLNGKRYHASVDDLVDWGFPTQNYWQKVGFEDITKYPRGR